MNTKLVIYPEFSSEIDNIENVDGLASAWVFYKFLKDQADYLSWDLRSTEIPDVKDYYQIFIVDCVFSKKAIEEWANQNRSILLIDHNLSTIENKSRLSSIISRRLEIRESRATLSWLAVFDDFESIPAFLMYIKDKTLSSSEFLFTEAVYFAISILLLRLEQFGEPRLKMIFDWFDYLSTLSRPKLLDYLRQATGFSL